MAIFLPQRWRVRPSHGRVEIDRANYFGNRFRVGLICDPYPRVIPYARLTGGGTFTLGVGAAGQQAVGTTANNWSFPAPFYPDLEVNKPITTLWIGDFAGSSGNNSYLHYRSPDYGWSTGFNAGSTTTRFAISGAVWNGEGSQAGEIAITRGKPTIHVASRTWAANNYVVSHYAGGKFLATSNTNGSDSAAGTIGARSGEVYIGNSGNGTSDYAALAFFGAFAGAMSAAEVAVLSENPWQVFRQHRRVFVSLPNRVIKTATINTAGDATGTIEITPAEWANVSSWPWRPRVRITSL